MFTSITNAYLPFLAAKFFPVFPIFGFSTRFGQRMRRNRNHLDIRCKIIKRLILRNKSQNFNYLYGPAKSL